MEAEYQNSPVREVVMATYFDPPLLDLRSEHVGLLWSRIRDVFPEVNQKPPYGADKDMEKREDEFLPMPRFWFVAKDREINLLQLQKGAFMLNWNRRDTGPRFSGNLLPAFDKYFRILQDFARDEVGVPEIGIGLCELDFSYVIDVCEYWRGIQDTARIMPFFSMPETGSAGEVAQMFNCDYIYSLANDLHLKVVIQCRKSTDKLDERTLVLEIAARSGQDGKMGKSQADKWFMRAHDAISDCFSNMTSEEIRHEYWKEAEKKS